MFYSYIQLFKNRIVENQHATLNPPLETKSRKRMQREISGQIAVRCVRRYIRLIQLEMRSDSAHPHNNYCVLKKKNMYLLI